MKKNNNNNNISLARRLFCDVILCFGATQAVSHRTVWNTDWTAAQNLTAAWAYDTQTTALGWIKEASVALARFWWMTIVIKVKTIIVAYRSRALGARVSVIIDAQTNVYVHSWHI